MTTNFECLCFLDNYDLCIVEIKLMDLPQDTQKSDRYQWLLINKKDLTIKALQFKSMDSSHEIEERFFDLGYLKFDYKKGVYISKEPSVQYPLENTNCEPVPARIIEAISGYLNECLSMELL
jgi:hypothetical protein